MKKQIGFYMFLSLLTQNIFGVLDMDEFLDAQTWSQRKTSISDKIRNGEITSQDLNFKGQVVSNLDFSNMYLQDINFEEGTFKNVNFSGADLTNARFFQATLEDNTTFEGAILKNAIFHYAILQNLNLKNTNIEGAGFTHTDLGGCDLRGTNLQDVGGFCGTKLQKVKFSNTMTLPDYSDDDLTPFFNLWCNGSLEEKSCCQYIVNKYFNPIVGVSNNDLVSGLSSNKNLMNVWLENADLHGADLSQANLEGASLIGANFQNANFNQSNLQKSFLTGSNLQGANLEDADLSNADLSYALLKDARFQGANMVNTLLNGAMLSDDFYLPDDANDQALLDAYNSCTDVTVKALLGDILTAKQIAH